MRLVTLLVSITVLSTACVTTAPARLSSAQILELAKEEFAVCCGIAGPGYDISVSGDAEGWQVSAMPVYSDGAPTERKDGEAPSIDEIEGTTILTAGGDVHLLYDPFGALLHVYRGQ